MSRNHCRVPNSLDRQVARELSGISHVIANLRGWYEEETGDVLSSVQDYKDKLIPFRVKKQTEDVDKLNKILSSNLASTTANAIRLLTESEGFTNSDIEELKEYLSTAITGFISAKIAHPGELQSWIDERNAQGLTTSRIDFITKLGKEKLIEAGLNCAKADFNNPKKKGTTYQNELLGKLLNSKVDAITTLLWLAQDDIFKREGVKIGKKLSYVVEWKNDETFEAELKTDETVKDGWMRQLDKESGWKQTGQEVRAFLSRQQMYEPKVSIVTKKDEQGREVRQRVRKVIKSKHGFPKYHNGRVLHRALQNILTGCTSQSNMMTRLERAAKEDINYDNIYKALIVDPSMQAAFYRDFHRTQSLYTRITSKAGKLTHSLIRSNGKKLTFYHYSNTITPESELESSIFTVEDGEVVVSGDKWNFYKGYIQDHINGNTLENITIATSYTGNLSDVQFSEVYDVIDTISNCLKLDLTKKNIEDLIANKVALKSFLADAKDMVTKDRRIGSGTPLTTMTSIFKDRIEGMLQKANDADSTSSKSVHIGDSTYFTDIVSCKLADSIDQIRSLALDAQFALASDSSSEQAHQLQTIVDKLKSYIMSEYGCSSEYYYMEDGQVKFYNEWLNILYNTNVENLTDPDYFIYKFSYDRSMMCNNILAEDFSEEYDLRTFIANYFSITTDADRGYARYPVFTTGDSLALKFITARKHSYNKCLDELVKVAKQEIARMKIEANVASSEKLQGMSLGKITTSADKNSKEVTGNFVYLKFLNQHKSELQEAITKGDEVFDAVVKEIIADEVFKEYHDEFYNIVKDTELFKTAEDGSPYFKEMLNITSLKPAESEENSPINGLFLYYLNTKLAYIQQYQFLGANPADYGLSTAMQKRYKAFNAPGSSMNIEARDSKGNLFIRTDEEGNPLPERVLYFKDNIQSAEDTDPAFMKALEAKWGKDDPRYKLYLENDATDGQGFRSLDSYRRVMGMAKQWTSEHQKAFDVINEYRIAALERAKKQLRDKGTDYKGEELDYHARKIAQFTMEEIDAINDLGVVFQPIKPHTSTIEKVPTDGGDILLVPVEHKYAEALIIPEMFPVGSWRRDLAIEMERNDIDLACSDQCVKVGCFGSADFRSSTSESFANDFSKGYVHSVPYKDYTIQTNVPEHINAMQLFGTQLRKHMFDAINLRGAYNFDGIDEIMIGGIKRSLSGDFGGEQFLKFYNALICANMTTDLANLTAKITNIKQLSDMLTELKSNDDATTINDLYRFTLNEEETAFDAPICEPTVAYDTESTFTSIFKREVNKQKINGGSCVQVSDFGISSYGNLGSDLKVHLSKDGKNIEYVDVAMAFDLSWTDATGVEHPLKFSDYCDNQGYLLSAEDTSRKAKDGELTKIEKDFPGILDIVLYRIPTEREYSIINGKVKRFFPKVMGGVVMVPSQFTTVAGFDFDIDKLYYFRKEFKAGKLSSEKTAKAWQRIYNIHKKEDGSFVGGNEIYQRLKVAKEDAVEDYLSVKEALSEFDKAFAKSEEYNILFGDESIEDELDPRKKNLYEFWDAAGLTKDLGKTASEYFSEFIAGKAEYNTWETYDYNKEALDNTTTARNNELIKCIQSRLKDPATFDARYTPGGFKNAITDADILKTILFEKTIPSETLEAVIGKSSIESIADAEKFAHNATKEQLEALDPDRDVTNVLTTATYNARNRVASKVIGIMANHNTSAVYSKPMEKFELKESINIFGYELKNLNGDNTGRNYMLTLAELLAASVDAVKTPVLNFLNINSYTANTAALLARLGLSTEEIGLFLSQPAIKEVCNYLASAEYGSLDRAIRKIAKKYNFNMNGDYNGASINKVDLFYGLKENNAGAKSQENVLRAFASIATKAQALSDFINKTKYTASNSIENSIGGLIALVYDNKAANERETLINQHLSMSFGAFGDSRALDEISKNDLPSPIRSDENISLQTILSEEYRNSLNTTPFAFEQMVHDAVVAYIKELGKYFPYTTTLYKRLYDTVYNNLVYGTLDKDIVDMLNRQFPLFLLQTIGNEGSLFSPDAESIGDNINKNYYTIDFPRELNELLKYRQELQASSDKETTYSRLQEQYPILKSTKMEDFLTNELLDNLFVDEYAVQISDLGESGVRYNIGIQNNSQFDKDVRSRLTEGWGALISSPNTEITDAKESLAHALFMYNFFTRGYEVGNNAFSNIAPENVLKTLMVNNAVSYYDFYNNLLKDNYGSRIEALNSFMILMYANNANNSKLVKPMSLDLSLTSTSGAHKGGDTTPDYLVKSNFGITEISFEGSAKSSWGSLALSKGKRAVPEGYVALNTAITAKDSQGNQRLFILKPLGNNSYDIANPNYNVRPINSRAEYIEFEIRGLAKTLVDYSFGENMSVPTESSSTLETKSTDSFIENLNEGDYEVIDDSQEQREAIELINSAEKNMEENGSCAISRSKINI